MHFVLHIALKALRHVQWDALLHIYASFTSVTTSPPLYLSLYKCVNLFLCVCVCVCGGRGPPHQMLLAGAVPVVLQKGAQPTCFSTPSSTDPFGLTRFISNQCSALFVTPVRLASIVCVCVCVCVCVYARLDGCIQYRQPPLCLLPGWWWCLQSLALLLQLDGLCCLRRLWCVTGPLVQQPASRRNQRCQ